MMHNTKSLQFNGYTRQCCASEKILAQTFWCWWWWSSFNKLCCDISM